MVQTADPDLGGALRAQSRTDELRQLLERYPDLDRPEQRRLRDLYRGASATEIIAIGASESLARKAKRLESEQTDAAEVAVIVLGIGFAFIIFYLFAFGLS